MESTAAGESRVSAGAGWVLMGARPTRLREIALPRQEREKQGSDRGRPSQW